MILETHCHACNRTMPAILWGLHKLWYGCPGKTSIQHDQENGLIHGLPIEKWKELWPGPLSPRCGQPDCHGGWVILGWTSRKCPTCARWKPTPEERLARMNALRS